MGSHYFVDRFSPFVIQFYDGWGIRYYSLAYIIGFFSVYWGMLKFRRWGWSSLNADEVADLFVWVVLGTLIGGRLAYCFVYELPKTLADPLWIIAFWRTGGIAGMASHGGMAGIILCAILYCRRHGKNWREVLDNLSMLSTIGIFLGRMANFINGELWGRPSTVPWAVIFPDAPLVNGLMVPRHPSQLYEGLGEGLILGTALFLLRCAGVKGGRIAVCYLVGYAVIRMSLECFREPDSQIGFLFWGVTMGQLLSVFILIGAVVLWRCRDQDKKHSISSS